MLRIYRSLGIGVVLMLLIVTPVAAQTSTSIQLQIDSPEMIVNGTPRPIDEHGSTPVIIDGRTLVPLRPVMEAIGGTVLWDADLRLLTIRDYLGENEIILKINSYDSVVNARTGPQLDVAPALINDVTMAPILFITSHLGFEIEWDDDTRTITITREIIN
ncbi:MAG: copper amine oxidase N-terminal domain-containing protein [Defluviitaleaceae bacterium]|nr:copper amine oxidase N-terminal domain-containing protein [Defluviitaleaceae bacterium]